MTTAVEKESHRPFEVKTIWGHGTCLSCGATNQDLGNGLCVKCYDKLCSRTHTYYRRKVLGICAYCGVKPAIGYISCPECREKENTRQRLAKQKKRASQKIGLTQARERATKQE